MLKGLRLSANSLPVSGLGYEDIPEVSTRLEGAQASGRTVFRESYLNSVVMEAAIASQVREYMDENEGASRQYNLSASRFDWRSGERRARREDFIPRYTREELTAQGYAVPDGFQFEDDGKMSLPRFAMYSQAYEDNEADAATAGAMPPGFLSSVASFAGGIAVGLGDPINAIPFGAGISRMKRAFEAGKAAKGARAGIIGRAMAEGAAEGAIGAAVADAISFPMANEWAADLGWREALTDIAVSGAFGSFFGALGGGLELHSYNKLGKAHFEAAQKAMGDMEKGVAPDVQAAIKPVMDEARANFESKMADPEYVRGLLDEEIKVAQADVESFKDQLNEIDVEQAPPLNAAAEGRLVLGWTPIAFRVVDGFSWLEMSPDLARRINLEEEWSGIDLAELPQTLMRPAAIFDMGEGRRAALIALTDTDGRPAAALVEMRTVNRGAKALSPGPDRLVDAFTEIDDIHLISGRDLSTVGLGRRIINDGRPLYADSGKLAEISGASRDLTDAAVYADSRILTPEKLARHLGKEDAGIDLDAGPVFEERRFDFGAEAAEVKSQVEALSARAKEDPATVREAQETQIDLAEQQLEDMAANGELTEAETDFLRNGSKGEGDDPIMGQREEQESLIAAQALVDGTECVIRRSLSGVN